MAKTLYMETTAINVNKTIGEIHFALAMAGASGVFTEYDEDREPSSVSFRLKVKGKDIPFILPTRIEPIFNHLQKKRSARTQHKQEANDREQAKRVAWRQILRWIQAQLALVETGMVEPAEVFLPYMQTGINQTFYQSLAQKGFRGLLTDGGK